MSFTGGGYRPGLGGAFVEGLIFDALFAYARMMNSNLTVGRTVKNQTEWEVYTDVLARFLGVDPLELRDRLIEERTNCRDLRRCSNRIFIWAHRKACSW